MRGKEDAHDYRYFPEPDLMPLEISPEWIARVKERMPELPAQKRARYESLGLSAYDANVMVEQMETALFFDKALDLGADVRITNNFLMKEVTAFLKEEKIDITQTKLTPESLTELVTLIKNDTISNNIGKQIIMTLLKEGGSAKEIVEKQGLSVISDEGALKEIIKSVIESNPEQTQAYRNGKDKLFGFFVGQVMKQTQGRANPQSLNKLLKEALDA
jgi:aspartyl-tRNA(Asn)/glutamyl-tRNA(Gln) amidotransferase subunit B